MTKLTAGDGTADDYFGQVVIDRNTAVIGAVGDGDLGDVSGSVYVYRLW